MRRESILQVRCSSKRQIPPCGNNYCTFRTKLKFLRFLSKPLRWKNIWKVKVEDAKHTHSSQPSMWMVSKQKKGEAAVRETRSLTV